MNAKSIKKENVWVYIENALFVGEILKKDFDIVQSSSGICLLNLTKITQKDIPTLQEYLDYLLIIEK